MPQLKMDQTDPSPDTFNQTKTPIYNKPYQSTVNPENIDLTNVLTSYVEGSSWRVTWYGQVLNGDNVPTSFDVNRPIAYQSYRKIKNFELMVTTPLSESQDEQSKEFDVTGEAIVYGFMTPNAGDTFIAEIDNGKVGIFNVTNSTKATYFESANYTIEYKLMSYVDPALVNNLDAKSIEVFEFVKALLKEGKNPLLKESDYALYGGLGRLYHDLISLYFRDFLSQERQTFLVPDQTFETYDHYLTNAMLNIVSTSEDDGLPKIRTPEVGGDRAMNNLTVWDALIRSNKSYMMTGIEKTGLLNTVMFRNFPNLTGIYYTGIDQVVYPRDDRTDVDKTYDHNFPYSTMLGDYVHDGKPRYSSLERILRQKDDDFFATGYCKVRENQGIKELPVIVPVTIDEYYVFSKGFYGVTGSEFQSRLEAIAHNAIEEKVIDRNELTVIGREAFRWPNLERFYYIPVILTLIKISLRST